MPETDLESFFHVFFHPIDFERNRDLIHAVCRISSSGDARCIAVLHTSAFPASHPPQTLQYPTGLGSWAAEGDLDFYVDGGLNPNACRSPSSLSFYALTQTTIPRANIPAHLGETILESGACAHFFAVESLNLRLL